jgi:hypothetical protein
MRLRLVNGLVYAGLAALAIAVIATPVVGSFRACVDRFSYAPDLALPWLWLGLLFAVLLLFADVARRLARGHRVGMHRYALLLGLVAASLAARRMVESPARPAVADGLAHAVARVEVAADQAFSRDHFYPFDPSALDGDLPDAVRDLGFRERGALPLRTRVRVRGDALEPLFVATADTRPGDVIFSVDRSRTRYWVTAFTLDRRGRTVPVSDGAGRLLMGAGADGQPRSRLDPAFPEYPRRLPLHVP